MDWRKALPQAEFLGDTAALGRGSRFFIDSRLVRGEAAVSAVFVPLLGERTDGHLYLKEVLAAGAPVCLCSVNQKPLAESLVSEFSASCLVLVPDPLTALQDLAAFHVASLDVKVVGITGSNGKTTTKEMMAAVLGAFAPTYATAGNFNSEIGLPLTALQIGPEHRFAVLEMGINHEGEMDALARVARPYLSIITNIGTAHIGILGSQQNIAREKRKICSLSGPQSHAVLPADDGQLALLKQGCPGTVHLFGFHASPVTQWEDRGLEGSRFFWRNQEVVLGLPGEHNVRNALAVLTAAEVLGVPLDLAAGALSGLKASFGRSQVIRGRITLVRDCYNANLDSMKSLFRMAGGWKSPARRVFVLGSMRELGSQSQKLHQELGRLAAGLDAAGVFFFGEEAEEAFEACRKARFSGHAEWTSDYSALEEAVGNFVQDGDLVVLKGSRGVELERLSRLWFEEEGGH